MQRCPRLFLCKLFHNILHRLHLIAAPCIGSAKDQPPVQVSFHCMNQSIRDTIRNLSRIACDNTMVTFLNRYLFFFRLSHKQIADRPSRHTHRTFHNADILFRRIQISLFIGLGGIAFLCRDKTGSHLYTVRSQFQSMIHIFFSRRYLLPLLPEFSYGIFSHTLPPDL